MHVSHKSKMFTSGLYSLSTPGGKKRAHPLTAAGVQAGNME